MQSVSQIMSYYWGVQKDLQKVGMKASVELYGENDDSVLRKMWQSVANASVWTSWCGTKGYKETSYFTILFCKPETLKPETTGKQV